MWEDHVGSQIQSDFYKDKEQMISSEFIFLTKLQKPLWHLDKTVNTTVENDLSAVGNEKGQVVTQTLWGTGIFALSVWIMNSLIVLWENKSHLFFLKGIGYSQNERFARKGFRWLISVLKGLDHRQIVVSERSSEEYP